MQGDEETLRSFISQKEEQPLNFDNLLSLLESEEGFSNVNLSVIQLFKTKYTLNDQVRKTNKFYYKLFDALFSFIEPSRSTIMA